MITAPQVHVGTVAELVGPRQAVLEVMTPDEGRGARLVYRMPTRGLIGLRGAILTATRGTTTLTSRFLEYAPVGGAIPRQRNGAVVATDGAPPPATPSPTPRSGRPSSSGPASPSTRAWSWGSTAARTTCR